MNKGWESKYTILLKKGKNILVIRNRLDNALVFKEKK
jgi:hypothetical protein